MNNNIEQILTALTQAIDIMVEERLNFRIAELKKLYAKNEKPLMSAQEAAEYLSLSINTIYRYSQTGKLNYYKPYQSTKNNSVGVAKNTKLMFKKAELDSYLLDEDKHYLSENELKKEVDTRIIRRKIRLI